jgi:hypothetical protein
MTTTAFVCVTLMVVLAIYDAIAIAIGGLDNSVSRFIKSTALKSPIFAFAIGFICGHLFGYMQ